MTPRDRLYIRHMLELAMDACEAARGVDRQAFDENSTVRFGQAYRIQIIGEAASRVSDLTRAANPTIPWAEIVGMRHRIVHEQMIVDWDIVWDVVTRDLPSLVTALKALAAGPDES